MESFLFQASVFLAAAVIAVPLASRLGLGSVLGYLAAGIVIGPVLGLTGGHEAHELQHFAEFGVVMMLFLIGLELEPAALWGMRHRLLGLGGLQVLLTSCVLALLPWLLGVNHNTSIAIGLIFSLSSTAIVLQTLSEKGLMQTSGGRSAFSVLLSQDIAVIPMLAFLPLLAAPKNPDQVLSEALQRIREASERATEPAHYQAVIGFLDQLPGWGMTLMTLGVVGGIIVTGIYLTRPVFRFVVATQLREMSTALALLIVCGISFLMYMVNLSPALGAFIAGVVLANSEFRHQIESDIEPFKGLLLGLFFITVGSAINFRIFFAIPYIVVGAALGVILIKGLILFGLARIFHMRGRNRALFTLSLAQAGEFGFVLITFSRKQNVLPPAMAEVMLLIVAVSMLITPFLFILYDLISKRLTTESDTPPEDDINDQGPVIIAGIGRFGQIVNRLVTSSGFKTVVLDNNLKTIQQIRKFGTKGFYGDPTRPELLRAAGLSEARVLVAALDNPEFNIRLVKYARSAHPDLHIVARARDRATVFSLYQAGANDIVREVFDSSLRAGRYVLENMGLSEYEAAQLEEAFYFHDREMVKELAALWEPSIRGTDNPAYIARARELEKELQTMLLSRLEASSGDDRMR